MSQHYKEVCRYGQVHGQCRCPAPEKQVRHVQCDTPHECMEALADEEDAATIAARPTPTEHDLEHRFTYHPPKPGEPAIYHDLRRQAWGLAERIAEVTGPSRERSLAITKLEEVVMWANAAIARNGLTEEAKRDTEPL